MHAAMASPTFVVNARHSLCLNEVRHCLCERLLTRARGWDPSRRTLLNDDVGRQGV
jgi:hypothetical protein